MSWYNPHPKNVARAIFVGGVVAAVILVLIGFLFFSPTPCPSDVTGTTAAQPDCTQGAGIGFLVTMLVAIVVFLVCTGVATVMMYARKNHKI